MTSIKLLVIVGVIVVSKLLGSSHHDGKYSLTGRLVLVSTSSCKRVPQATAIAFFSDSET